MKIYKKVIWSCLKSIFTVDHFQKKLCGCHAKKHHTESSEVRYKKCNVICPECGGLGYDPLEPEAGCFVCEGKGVITKTVVDE